MCENPPQGLEYSEYAIERRMLYEWQQKNQQSMEKTLLALSASFLAFSVTFVSLLHKVAESGTEAFTVTGHSLLYFSWGALGLAVLSVFVSFPLSIRAFSVEMEKLGDALDDVGVLERRNRWTVAAYVFYWIAGSAFVVGLAALMIFCGQNVACL